MSLTRFNLATRVFTPLSFLPITFHQRERDEYANRVEQKLSREAIQNIYGGPVAGTATFSRETNETILYVKCALLTLVHPIRYAVVDTAEHPRAGYLIVIGHLRLRSVVDIILMHVDESVAARRPRRELQRRRFVRRQYRFRPAQV